VNNLHNITLYKLHNKLSCVSSKSSQSSESCRASRASRVKQVELCCSTSSTQPKCMGSTRRMYRVVSSRAKWNLGLSEFPIWRNPKNVSENCYNWRCTSITVKTKQKVLVIHRLKLSRVHCCPQLHSSGHYIVRPFPPRIFWHIWTLYCFKHKSLSVSCCSFWTRPKKFHFSFYSSLVNINCHPMRPGTASRINSQIFVYWNSL